MMLKNILLSVSLMVGTSCMEHKVGGKTAHEVFDDAKVADLAIAACNGDTETVNDLVQSGVDVNGGGISGSIPLLWALSCENLDGIEALMKLGGDPNYRANHGLTPIRAAAGYRNPELLKLILKYGGDPDSVGNNPYNTALQAALSLAIHYADNWEGLSDDNWTNFDILIEAGADINKRHGGRKTDSTIVEELVYARRYGKALELIESGYTEDINNIAETVQISVMRKRTSPKFNDFSTERTRLYEYLETEKNIDFKIVKANIEERWVSRKK